MQIQKNKTDNQVTLHISGRLDTNTAPELETFISDIFSEADILIFDLSDLEYLSSAGLRVILHCEKQIKKKNGKFIVANVPNIIMDVFEVTGFTDFLIFQ